jgi:hypothetical protein
MKPSTLKREHSALQNSKFINFYSILLVIFVLMDSDPDPATKINADPRGSGSEKTSFDNTDGYRTQT